MNHTELFNSARHKYNEITGNEYYNIFNDYLNEFVTRRRVFIEKEIRIFKINNQERQKKFKEVEAAKENSKTLTLFHGPEFQKQPCKYDFSLDMCCGHSDDLMCFTENPLYTYCNQGKRNFENSLGYILLCKLNLGLCLEKDPEDTTPIIELFSRGYNTVIDYGNRKVIKREANDILPMYLITYRRKYNSRLDLEDCLTFNEEPEVIYEELDAHDEEFKNVSRLLPKTKYLSIKKIINLSLTQKYEEAKRNAGKETKEWTVYHGTTFENIDLIARYNFDWRKAMYGRFGWGIHFCGFPEDVPQFPMTNLYGALKELKWGPKQCMLMCYMLYNESKTYNVKSDETKLNDLEIPPDGYDTARYNGKYIKFHDNCFLPKYKIVYELQREQP